MGEEVKISKSLQNKLSALNDKYNKKGDDDNVAFLTSGSIILDAVVSNGKGLPLGKMIEIHSEAGIGKSTLILQACLQACRKGKVCIYLDVEDGANDDQLDSIGLLEYKDTLFFVFPVSTYRDVEEVLAEFDGEDICYIVLDSITSLMPDELLTKSVADILPGLKARYDSLFLQKCTAYLKRNVCSIVLINQMRTTLNFMGRSSSKAAGGKALEFYPDVRIELKKISDLTKKAKTIEGVTEIKYGSEVSIKCLKNRFNNPFIEGVLSIVFGKGASNLSAYTRWLQNNDCIKRSGAWYTITVGELEGKVCGANGILGWVKDNLQEVNTYIMNNGGFILLEVDEDGGDANGQ